VRIEKEVGAFRAFMAHIRDVDSASHIVVGIQVENEIAVFGSDRRNPKMWRDLSPAAHPAERPGVAPGAVAQARE